MQRVVRLFSLCIICHLGVVGCRGQPDLTTPMGIASALTPLVSLADSARTLVFIVEPDQCFSCSETLYQLEMTANKTGVAVSYATTTTPNTIEMAQIRRARLVFRGSLGLGPVPDNPRKRRAVAVLLERGAPIGAASLTDQEGVRDMLARMNETIKER